MTRRRVIAGGLMIFAVVGSGAIARAQGAASATSVAVNAEANEALRQRAAAYWAARLAGDERAQWDLLEPRAKGRLTPKEYASERGENVRYLGYQVESASVEGYFATVKVRVMFEATLPRVGRIPPQAVVLDDRWVQVGGIWYHQVDDIRPPRRQSQP
jgi:hypothetical protein